jgi:hypothetical protein
MRVDKNRPLWRRAASGALHCLLGSSIPTRAVLFMVSSALILTACAVSGNTSPRAIAAPLPTFFSSTSVWNAPLAGDAKLAANSSRLSAALSTEVAKETVSHTGPWINTNSWSVPVYIVGSDVPRVHVTLDRYSPILQRDFDSVPIPTAAHAAAGSDASMVVYQPSSNTLWEFWRANRLDRGWHASWGGELTSVSTSSGYYGNDFGGSGTGLSLAGGLMMIKELEAGSINHALAISIPNTERGVFTWPARRSEGSTRGPTAIPEGTHFRISPKVNLSALHLTPAGLLIARAAQRYGMIVRDTGGNVAFYAQDPTTTNGDPYGKIFGGENPNRVLENFPWNDLEVVAPNR